MVAEVAARRQAALLAHQEDAAQQRAALDHQQRLAQANAKSARASANLEAQLATTRSTLNRNVASRRAAMGAQGTATASGSLRSLIDGLHNDANEEAKRARRETQDRIASLRTEVQAARRQNLLDLAAQRQRNDLMRRTQQSDIALAQRQAALELGKLRETRDIASAQADANYRSRLVRAYQRAGLTPPQ